MASMRTEAGEEQRMKEDDGEVHAVLPSGTPKRRRKSQATGSRNSSVGDVLSLHMTPYNTEVSFVAYLLASDDEVKEREMKGGNKGTKYVLSLILGDKTAVIQTTLWGEVAQKACVKLQQYLEEAPENKFPVLQCDHLLVSKFRAETVEELRRLQSTARTSFQFLEYSALQIEPPQELMAKTIKSIEVAPLILCVQGIIMEVQDVTYTQNDICMKELTMGTMFGATIPIMMYGAQAEETYEVGEELALFFAETRPPRTNDGKAFLWVYDSSYVLSLGKTMTPLPKLQELQIVGK